MTWKTHLNQTFSHYYLFGSRPLTHVVFWLVYYISFALIWASNHGLFASFYLEFILLPVRIAATYSVLYWLMPQYLLTGKVVKFLLYMMLLLAVCGLVQRLIIFAFYEELLIKTGNGLFDLKAIMKSSLLINTTVMLAMTIKWYGLYRNLLAQLPKNNNKIEIKADRRTHLIDLNNIRHIEGLGNYVNIHLNDGQSLTTYSSIKKILAQLPDYFLRCHRSHVVNSNYIDSFNNEGIHMGKDVIPRGKEIDDATLKRNHHSGSSA